MGDGRDGMVGRDGVWKQPQHANNCINTRQIPSSRLTESLKKLIFVSFLEKNCWAMYLCTLLSKMGASKLGWI